MIREFERKVAALHVSRELPLIEIGNGTRAADGQVTLTDRRPAQFPDAAALIRGRGFERVALQASGSHAPHKLFRARRQPHKAERADSSSHQLKHPAAGLKALHAQGFLALRRVVAYDEERDRSGWCIS